MQIGSSPGLVCRKVQTSSRAAGGQNNISMSRSSRQPPAKPVFCLSSPLMAATASEARAAAADRLP